MARKFCVHGADAWCRCNGKVGEDVLWRRSFVRAVQMHGADAWCRCSSEVGEDALWQRSFVRTVQMFGADAAVKYARTPRGLSDSRGIAFGPIYDGGHARMCGNNADAKSVDVRGCAAVQKICGHRCRCDGGCTRSTTVQG